MQDLISRQAAIDAIKKDKIDLTNPNVVAVFKATGDFEKVETQVMTCDRHIKILENLPSEQPAQQWIPCSERLPEEDHWLGGSGRQFSEEVMVTIVNHSDEDTWVDMTQTLDGEWACELPKYCEIVAWMPLPEAWKGKQNE